MIVINRAPVREQLTPDADGLTTDFEVSQDYKTASVSVWQYGVRLRPDWGDGYELPGGRVIRFKIAPLPESTLEAQYDPL